MKQVASLRYDVIFKKAFSRPDLFTALVKDFLGIQLEIDRVEHDKVFVPPVGNVTTKFDLFAEDIKNRVIVEVQHAHGLDTYERFLYYQCGAMVETVISSNNYSFPMTVFTLVFFTQRKTPSPDSGIIVHDFAPRDLITGRLLDNIYRRKHKLVFVFTNKAAHLKTPTPYREWMQAIHDSLDGEVDEVQYSSPFVQELFRVIEQSGITPDERAYMKDEYNRQEGEMLKFEEGKEDGLKEGEEKGRKETQEKLARVLKERGNFSIDEIVDMTGLSFESVEVL